MPQPAPCPQCGCPITVQDLVQRDEELEREEHRRRQSRADHIHGDLTRDYVDSSSYYIQQNSLQVEGSDIAVCARCGIFYVPEIEKVVRRLRFKIRARLKQLDPVSSLAGIEEEVRLESHLGVLEVEQERKEGTDAGDATTAPVAGGAGGSEEVEGG